MGITFEIDHIVPKSAGGATDSANLCLSCPTCNRYKGKRQSAIDPISGNEASLFHPLDQEWTRHFRWSADKAEIEGLSPTGRATISALQMNRSAIVQLRKYWLALDLHPSTEQD